MRPKFMTIHFWERVLVGLTGRSAQYDFKWNNDKGIQNDIECNVDGM